MNPASEEGAERTEGEEEVKKVDGAEEAESSKTAEARAAATAERKSVEEVKASSSSSTRSPSSSSPPPAGSSGATPPSSSSSSSDPPKPTSSSKEIAKPAIPDVYPQVLALPITRRPLFPGFYKAVTITSPPVIKAIRDLLAHGQPYIGAFLLKDSQSDSDVITSMDQVHPVGVFAQITSVFGSPDTKGNKEEGAEPKPETLTAVLYPHRRIRIDELVTQSPTAGAGEGVPLAQVVNEVTRQEIGVEEDVPSFEKEVPSVEEVREELGTVSQPREEEPAAEGVFPPFDSLVHADHAEKPAKPLSPINFLHPLLPQISLTNVTNVEIEPYKKDSQMVRAVMGELISVFKDIAQLQPIFREQSELHCI